MIGLMSPFSNIRRFERTCPRLEPVGIVRLPPGLDAPPMGERLVVVRLGVDG